MMSQSQYTGFKINLKYPNGKVAVNGPLRFCLYVVFITRNNSVAVYNFTKGLVTSSKLLFALFFDLYYSSPENDNAAGLRTNIPNSE